MQDGGSMRKSTNIINTIICFILTIASLLLVVYICNSRYAVGNLFSVALWLIIGGIISGIINTFAHELGHLLIGKINGFAFSRSIAVCKCNSTAPHPQ